MTTTQERPETAYQKSIRRAREQFAGFVGEHEMTVLLDTLDDGTPYRHVRFAKPGTSIYSFNLVTWPGHLAISGDLSAFTFRRLHDMFDFFRGPGPINPGYWGEKVIAGAHGTDHGEARYCSEQFVEQVNMHTDWACEELSDDDQRSLRQAVREELTTWPPEYLEEAHQRLADFRWESPPPVRPLDRLDVGGRVEFRDKWDWDLGGFDHHFLLACHAVQWGVNKYLGEHPDRFIPEGR